MTKRTKPELPPTERKLVSNNESEAAQWAALIDARPGEELPELDRWLAGDRRRNGDLLRAQAILHLLGAPAAPAACIEDQILKPTTRRLALAGGTIAAIAAAIILFLAIPRPGAIYETGAGETHQIALADGSAVAIDSRSRIEVDFDGATRQISMANGRAIFRVAKSDHRPFQVVIGAITITDIGTEFQIFDDPANGEIEVLVTEGEVRIDSPAARLSVIAGQKVRLARTARGAAVSRREQLSSREVMRTTAWREGRLELDGDTLAQAVAHLNRANQVQIVVTDNALAAEPLYGSFRMNDPSGFAKAIAVSLDARVIERDGKITIYL